MSWILPTLRTWAVPLAGLGWAGSAMAAGPAPALPIASELPALVCFTNTASWERESVVANQVVLVSPWMERRGSWNEVVPSWNIQPSAGATLTAELELRLAGAESAVRRYDLGRWTSSPDDAFPRTSRRGQKDDVAEVQTDTLVLKTNVSGLRVRLTLGGTLAERPEALRLMALSLADTRVSPQSRLPLSGVWGTTLEVPERSQIAHVGGEGWCSPTSVSMVMAWWAGRRGEPAWDRPVPDVAAGVNDPGWPGTGNWTFNVAYAGSFPGLRAVAVRLPDLRSVEEWIEAGVPVVMSVHPPALRGGEVAPGSGHLIVGVGFTAEGDLVANDPWARLERGQRVRRVYQRANVERAWVHAHRTAYLVLPEDLVGRLPAEWR